MTTVTTTQVEFIIDVPEGAPPCCCGESQFDGCGCEKFDGLGVEELPELEAVFVWSDLCVPGQAIILHPASFAPNCIWESDETGGEPIRHACIKCIGTTGTCYDYELSFEDISCCPISPRSIRPTSCTCSDIDGKLELVFDFEMNTSTDPNTCPSGCGYPCVFPVSCNCVVREL